MQVVRGGPDLPVEVLQAQEDGRLILFCGAGLSMGTGLPSFAGLVSLVLSRLGTTPSEVEQLALDQEGYDRVLGLLESRFGRAVVRDAVKSILSVSYPGVPPAHKAVADLATQPGSKATLVTTNFDNRFDLAAPNAPTSIAPALPVPKSRRWNGIVYIHGRISANDPAGDSLVLTAADFGVAYLSEGWAARFITELFNQYTILFIGYTANDPVMRYLIDALALERLRGGRVAEAYALAPINDEGADKTAQEWEGKNIRPILYDPIDNHRLFTETLAEWAAWFRGGLLSRQARATDIGRKDPAALPSEDVSQLCWAIAEPSGAVAREFANLGKNAPLAWLHVFERIGLLQRPPDQGFAQISILGASSASIALPSVVTREILRWLTAYFDSAELISWVVTKGPQLHPWFQALIRWRLGSEKKLPPAFVKTWRVVAGDNLLEGPVGASDYYRLAQRLESDPWDAILRWDLLNAFEPALTVRQASPVPAEHPGTTEPTIADLVWIDCTLRGGHALEPILAALRARSDWAQIASDIAWDVTSLLRSALELQATVERAAVNYDLSYLDRPSVAPHEQNGRADTDDWVTMIEVNREVLHVLLNSDASRARRLVDTWRDIPFPAFRRLVLYAASL